MIRLLLIFILLPAILFGQVRRKDVVDSLHSAGTLNHISQTVSSYRGAAIDQITATDSAEYVTLTVRVHVPIPKGIPPMPACVLTALPTPPIAHVIHQSAAIPPLPAFIADADSIPKLAPTILASFPMAGLPTLSPREAHLPPTPFVQPYLIDMTPPLSTIRFSIRELSFSAGKPRTVPAAPYVQPYLISRQPLIAAVTFRINQAVQLVAQGTTVPPLPEVECWTIFPVPGLDAAELTIVRRPNPHMDTVFIRPFREEKFEVEGMHLSDEGYALLEKMEGFSPSLYILGDGGYTIGFGFFIPYSDKWKWNKNITMEEAEQLMRQKMPTYEDQVKQYINVTLTQREFDALVMLAYNLGGFSRATSIVNDINSQAGFDKLQADWNRFIHSKAPGVTRGLMNRRRDELGVRNEANYQHDRKVQVIGQRRQ